MRRFVLTAVAMLLAAVFSAEAAGALTSDPSLDTGRNFAPFVLSLKPGLQMSPLPGWMQGPAVVRSETATIEVPVPAPRAATPIPAITGPSAR